VSDGRPCLQCQQPFTQRRSHQKFCGKACRLENHAAHKPEYGTAAKVKAVRILRSGKVSIVVHVPLDERERALRLTPGQDVQMVAA